MRIGPVEKIKTVEHPIVEKEEVLRSLPPVWTDRDLLPEIRTRIRRSGRKVVVIDDDPTGNQTVHDVFLRTGWEVEELKESLAGEEDLFFILTNTRSMPRERARALNALIARNLCRAAREVGVEFTVISRGDSTLRWHYPDELEALQEVLVEETGMGFDGYVLVPAFFEGGRYTVGDIHYVQDQKALIPAGRTEFSRDRVFGFLNSHLAYFVEEKTGGKVSSHQVGSIGLENLRKGGPAYVAEFLQSVSGGKTIVLNAADYKDLEVFVLGLLEAEEKGKRFLIRSSASYVRVRGGIAARPFLTPSELASPASSHHGGLVVVGSYVGKTSEQIDKAKEMTEIEPVEVDVQLLLDKAQREPEISRVADRVNDSIGRGRDVMVYTSRTLVTTSDEEGDLGVGMKISSALVEVVQRLNAQPAFLIAKGGITSNDVAMKGLGVKLTKVLGQAAPGIPVWSLGGETRYPGMPYIVFPGNVGNRETLAEVVKRMRKQGTPGDE